MKIIYREKSLIFVCEIQYNALMMNEPQNVERVLFETETHVTTQKRTYDKSTLEMRK
jgi:hypothetical protein